MRILSPKDADQWLSENRIPLSARDLRTHFTECASFKLPGTSQAHTVLARFLAGSLEDSLDEAEGALSVLDWDIAEENLNLFYGYRKSFGEDRSLEDARFHLFEKRDLDLVECLIDLSLYFQWTTLLIAPDQRVVVRPNHDGMIDIFAVGRANLQKYEAIMEHMKLSRLKDCPGELKPE